MLKATSALATAASFQSDKLAIVERTEFSLIQISGAEKDLKKALKKIPAAVGVVQNNLLRISPTQIWSFAPVAEAANCFITPLSSSRVCIEISGAAARNILAKCAAIDFHPTQFTPGQFVQTGIHHVPVLIQCLAGEFFHLYVMRTFALSIWDYVTDAGQEYV
jgi:sarcosine oxidase gamma subunit